MPTSSKRTNQALAANKKAAEHVYHILKKKSYEMLKLENESLLEDYRRKEIAANKLYYLRKFWEKKLRDDIFNLNKALQDAEFERARKSVPKQFLNAQLLNACQDSDWISALILLSFGAKMGPEGKAFLNLNKNRYRGNFLHPIKEFGLVLGIKATSEDGTYSGVARIGPTYNLMTNAIREYSNAHPEDKDFKEIAQAFSYTNAHGNYDGSVHGKGFSNALLSRIEGPPPQMTSVPTGCVGHAMALTVVPDPNPPSGGGYIVFTNRWTDASTSAESGTHIFRVKDLSLIDKDFIDTMIDGVFKSSYATIIGKIESISDPDVPSMLIDQVPQKRYNCTIASPRSNQHGVLLCLKAIDMDIMANDLSDHDKTDVYNHYKDFTHDMRRRKIQELAYRIEAEPKDPYYNDLVTLARAFIDQHPDKDEEYKNILADALDSVEPQIQAHRKKPRHR